ncbi:hypothetical protein [Pirellulimonas nuda]|uniref:hypothetical protein n=1 Tax=Pirellulimonas nuda TaxID=2528009 RepID=UPI003704C3A6
MLNNLTRDLTGLKPSVWNYYGDIDGDGHVGRDDFRLLKNAFLANHSATELQSILASVPEPTGVSLAAVVGFLVVARHRAVA